MLRLVIIINLWHTPRNDAINYQRDVRWYWDLKRANCDWDGKFPLNRLSGFYSHALSIANAPHMVHILWASHARNQWSDARLHIFLGNKLYGIHKYTVFFYQIVIVYVRYYHNIVKKYCLEALHEKKKLKPSIRSLISCMKCSVYVHH